MSNNDKDAALAHGCDACGVGVDVECRASCRDKAAYDMAAEPEWDLS